MKNTISSKVKVIYLNNLPKKGAAKASVLEIIFKGFTRTGNSGYSNGFAKKSIWTNETVLLCNSLGLFVEFGNDAPRGGANGEFVALIADKRKNKIIHSLHKLIERHYKIAGFRILRKNKEFEEKRAAEFAAINAEFEKVKPFVKDYLNEIIESNKLNGAEKWATQADILKSILKNNKITGITNFWQVWKQTNKLAYSLHEQNLRNEFLEKSKQNKDQFITKEFFHKKTKACYLGINAFLKNHFGTENIEGLPLSKVVEIVPKSYVELLLK